MGRLGATERDRIFAVCLEQLLPDANPSGILKDDDRIIQEALTRKAEQVRCAKTYAEAEQVRREVAAIASRVVGALDFASAQAERLRTPDRIKTWADDQMAYWAKQGAR